MRVEPLCPYCYRPACPWLVAYKAAELWHRGPNRKSPPPEACPFHDEPLPPAVRRKLAEELERC